MELLRKLKEATTSNWHSRLNEKSGIYDAWDKNPLRNHVHWAILITYVFAFTFISLSSFDTAYATPKILSFETKNSMHESVEGQVEFWDTASGEKLGQGRNKSLVPTTHGQKLKLKFKPDDSLITSLEYEDVEIDQHDSGLGAAVFAVLNNLGAAAGKALGQDKKEDNTVATPAVTPNPTPAPVTTPTVTPAPTPVATTPVVESPAVEDNSKNNNQDKSKEEEKKSEPEIIETPIVPTPINETPAVVETPATDIETPASEDNSKDNNKDKPKQEEKKSEPEVAEEPVESGPTDDEAEPAVETPVESPAAEEIQPVEPDENIEISLDEPAIPEGWNKIISLGEVNGFKFSKGRLTKIAEGKDLFKCTDWDFANQNCDGDWQKIADIEPGKEYTAEFEPGNAGFAEKSNKVNLLDEDKNLLEYTELSSSNKSERGTENVTIVLNSAKQNESDSADESSVIPESLSSIVINAVDSSSESNDIILSSISSDPVAPEGFVIDTSDLDSKEVKIVEKAKSGLLLSCSSFDEENSACEKWKKDADISLNENFIISISSPGKSVFGQSRDGVVVLDENLEVLSSGQEVKNSRNGKQVSVQLTDLSPNKITTYFDVSKTSSTGEVGLNTEAVAFDGESGKVMAVNLEQAQALGADIEGTAEGWDLFKCSDFDFENKICNGKYVKNKDLVKGEDYKLKVSKQENTQGFLESSRKIALINAKEELVNSSETETTENGDVVVKLVPDEENPIRNIKVKNPDMARGNDLKISPTVNDPQSFLQGFAIDPTQIKSDGIELELEAKGNTLLKCKDWNFTDGTCLGLWVKYRDLTPGEIYTLPIDDLDPGFIETSEATSTDSSPTPEENPATETSPETPTAPSSDTSPADAPAVPSLSQDNSAQPPSTTRTSTGSSSRKISSTGSANSGGLFKGFLSLFGNKNESPKILLAPIPIFPTVSYINTILNKNHTVIIPGNSILKKDLYLTSDEDEVRSLQQFLNKNGFTVAKSGPGSPGLETNYFGPSTQKALAKFQEVHADKILKPAGLDKPTGIFGSFTKKFINSFFNQVEQDVASL
jgi:hypothetical protein